MQWTLAVRRLLRGLMLGATALVLGAAAWPFGVWSGYRYPTEASWTRSAARAPCPEIGIQNLDAERARLLLTALEQVCTILSDPEFERQVRTRTDWIMDCTSDGKAGQPITADAILAALVPPSHRFSVVARKPNGAVAVTNLHYQAIAIRKLRFEQWASTNIASRAEMIETLAHEMTHLVPEPQRPKVSLFKDEGHVANPTEPAQCADARLVSYGIGKIVADIWRTRQP